MKLFDPEWEKDWNSRLDYNLERYLEQIVPLLDPKIMIISPEESQLALIDDFVSVAGLEGVWKFPYKNYPAAALAPLLHAEEVTHVFACINDQDEGAELLSVMEDLALEFRVGLIVDDDLIPETLLKVVEWEHYKGGSMPVISQDDPGSVLEIMRKILHSYLM